jgi:hypothetical protein
MPKIRLAPEVVDILSTTSEPEDAPDTSVWSEDGAAGAQTTIVPPAPAAVPLLAWSVDEDETVPLEHRSWASVWGTATVLLSLAAAVAVVIGILGWVAVRQDAPVVTPSTMPAAALPPISTPVPTTTVTVAAAPAPTVTVEAAAPTSPFSGRYTETDTAPSGHVIAAVWDVTPCGDGCVYIAEDGVNNSGGRVWLADGQWSFEVPIKAICADGSSVPFAGRGRYAIDAITLRGTLQDNWTKDACGMPPGVTTHHIALARENQ